MAPEVLQKSVAYDSSADWFSLGCMLYKLLRGCGVVFFFLPSVHNEKNDDGNFNKHPFRFNTIDTARSDSRRPKINMRLIS